MMKTLKLPASVFWLKLGRGLLFVYAAAVLVLTIISALMFPAYARSHPEQFTPNVNWTSAQVQTALSQLGWPETFPAYFDLSRYLVFFMIGSGLGLLLLWRRPPGLFTFFLSFVFISFGVGESLYQPLLAYLPVLQYYFDFFDGAGWQFFFIIFFLFPTGRPVPGWTRWVVAAWLVFTVVTQITDQQLYQNQAWFFLLLVLLALGSQVYRYFFRSDLIQRQQTKWVITLIILYVIFVSLILPFAFREPEGENIGFSLVVAYLHAVYFNILFIFFPVTVTIAIFRYKLWDIDLAIRRTLVYTVLTALIGLVYYGMVTVLQSVFAGVSGQQQPLVLVVSTLASAALFSPLRRSIQQVIDRRFFRQRYDAAAAQERFSQTLRERVDLPGVQKELLSVVQETVQPAVVSVWLATGAARRRFGPGNE